VATEPSSTSIDQQKLRLWPAVVTVLWAAIAVATLFTIPFDDHIQGWQRVVGSGIVLILAAILLAVWLVFFSRMSWRGVARTVVFCMVLLGMLVAVFRVRAFNGDMLPLLAPRGWVLSLFGAPPQAGAEALANSADIDKLLTAGDRNYDVVEFLGPGRKPEFDIRLDPDWTSNAPEQLWRQPAGEGFGSFSVVGNLAITQEQLAGGEQPGEAIVCYNFDTGEPLWRHVDEVYFTSGLGGNGPRATPTIDDDLVYSMGATGILNCLRLTTGESVWSRNILEDNSAAVPMWGISCSPLVVDDLVIVTGGDQGEGDTPHAVLLAYDKKTGEPRWRGLGKDNASYGSPQVATVAGIRQVMIFTASQIVGHDLVTGKQLWMYEWPGNMPNVAQVVALDDNRVFASKGYATGSVLLHLQANANGGIDVAEQWRRKKLMKTKFTNAVLHDGYAYGLSDGRLECIDVEDGKQQWKVRGDYGQGQVVRVGDHLLIQAESGDVALVNLNPEAHEEVARFSPLSARTWNYPVIIGDRLLVRNDQEMACYRLKLAE